MTPPPAPDVRRRRRKFQQLRSSTMVHSHSSTMARPMEALWNRFFLLTIFLTACFHSHPNPNVVTAFVVVRPSTTTPASSSLSRSSTAVVSHRIRAVESIPSSSTATQLSAKAGRPAFSQVAHTTQADAASAAPTGSRRNGNKNRSNNTQKQPSFRSDSKLGSAHAQRVKTAGREGTKRYINPSKVFVGNLPYSVTSETLSAYLCDRLALPPAVLLRDVKVVTNWKTGRSKGYAFCVFTEPIYATVCLDRLDGTVWQNRTLSVHQGVRKQVEATVYVKKQTAKTADRDDDDAPGVEDVYYMDPDEARMLRALDPDLVEGVKIAGLDDVLDQVNLSDAQLELGVDDDDDDDDDDEVDGIWYEDDYEDDSDDATTSTDDSMAKNRATRRDEKRKNKKKKPPAKGFGL